VSAVSVAEPCNSRSARVQPGSALPVHNFGDARNVKK
jgi:hypothetical protein